MKVKLTKNQEKEVTLSRKNANLKRLAVVLNWDSCKSKNSAIQDVDMDVSIVCICGNNKYDSFVYYGRPNHPSGAIKYHKTNSTKKRMEINLEKLPKDIKTLEVFVNIYNAEDRNQDFSKIRNCYIHIIDMDTDEELVRYEVGSSFDEDTDIFVIDIYKDNSKWKSKTIAESAKACNVKTIAKMRCKR